MFIETAPAKRYLGREEFEKHPGRGDVSHGIRQMDPFAMLISSERQKVHQVGPTGHDRQSPVSLRQRYRCVLLFQEHRLALCYRLLAMPYQADRVV